jgi:aspartyl-tRNA(Asn)/glutamyl-tRNA(Gln) amidotransferase subunit C
MNSTEFDVSRFAKLARLALSADERVQFGAELRRILTHFEAIARRNDSPDPASATPGVDGQRERALRVDTVETSPCRDALLTNAPARAEGAFSVPRVIE